MRVKHRAPVCMRWYERRGCGCSRKRPFVYVPFARQSPREPARAPNWLNVPKLRPELYEALAIVYLISEKLLMQPNKALLRTPSPFASLHAVLPS